MNIRLKLRPSNAPHLVLLNITYITVREGISYWDCPCMASQGWLQGIDRRLVWWTMASMKGILQYND